MKLNNRQKDTLFKMLIFGIIYLLCFILRLIVSAISGVFNWTVEQLTSSLAGLFIQILDLVLAINGIIFFIYLIILLILFIKN